jgi:hypothetical protein
VPAALIEAAVAIVVAVVAAVGAADNWMENPMTLSTRRNFGRLLRLVVMVPLLGLLPAAGTASQTTFKSPQDAVDAIVTAIKADKTDALVSILGPEGQKLASSGDPVADEAARTRFATAYDEGHELKQEGDARVVLIVGKEDFPFPIPLVAKEGAWSFDTAAGAEEILNRRIGENELAAIEVMRAYIDAQHEYAETDRDGKGDQYARKFVSSESKRDGLYWPTAAGEPDSPLGPLIADARAEGYAARSGHPEPYHGYVFKILTAQGNNATGGARDYIVNGRMIGGFALVAAPAEYGNSGVMTFIVNHDGVVFQKDLGPDTVDLVTEMTAFDRDSTWSEVKSE